MRDLPLLAPLSGIYLHVGWCDETVDIFREANWDITLLRHQKGHMVNLAQQQELVDWVQETSDLVDNGS